MNTTRTRKAAVADVVATKPARIRATPSAAAPSDAGAGSAPSRSRSKAEPAAEVVAAKPARKRAAPSDVAPKRKSASTKAAKPDSSGSKAAVTRKPRSAAAAKVSRAPLEAKPIAAMPTVRRSAKAKAKAKASEPTIDMQVRDAVVARLDAMKANDLKVIDVRGKTSITDFLVIVSGTSTRHVKSMGDEVVVTAKKHGMPPMGIEGEKDAEWMLVDLGDTVVHLMLPRIREFYGLERLWTLAGESRAAAFSS